MSDFIRPELRLSNIPQQKFASKINLLKKDVSLQFLLAKDTDKDYKVSFLISIIPPKKERNPSQLINPSTVNMSSLKTAILGHIKPLDKEYMKMVEFDTRKVIFSFDDDKWLNDSIVDGYSTTRITRFARVFKFRKAIPYMIMMDPLRTYFGDFIIRKFKQYMESKNKEGKWFTHLFPDTARTRLRGKIRNMFNWEYDITWNNITATLKPIYALAIIYAIGAMTKKLRANDIKSVNQQKMFSTKVKQNLKQFDYAKFDKYSKRKGFM